MAKFFIDRADSYMLLDDYDSALLNSKKAIELDRSNETAYEQIATVYLYYGELNELEKTLAELKSINPNNEIIITAENYCNRLRTLTKEAEICSIQKNFIEAIIKINTALEMAKFSEYFSSLKNHYMIEERKQNEVRFLYLNILQIF